MPAPWGEEFVVKAVESGEVPVRGVRDFEALPRRIERQIGELARIEVRASFIFSIHNWREVQIEWSSFANYAKENLIPTWWKRHEPQPIPVGRKTKENTKKAEIIRSFESMAMNGEVSLTRGGLTAAANSLQEQFSDYRPDSIRKIIQPAFNELKLKRGPT
jgi:hypothetical protein